MSSCKAKWLYEPKTETDYQGYIQAEDQMMISWTYQHLMNIAIANCRKPITEMALRKELKRQLDMAIEDMMESFELCVENMLKELNKEENL